MEVLFNNSADRPPSAKVGNLPQLRLTANNKGYVLRLQEIPWGFNWSRQVSSSGDFISKWGMRWGNCWGLNLRPLEVGPASQQRVWRDGGGGQPGGVQDHLLQRQDDAEEGDWAPHWETETGEDQADVWQPSSRTSRDPRPSTLLWSKGAWASSTYDFSVYRDVMSGWWPLTTGTGREKSRDLTFVIAGIREMFCSVSVHHRTHH